jgi:hypothetical protein
MAGFEPLSAETQTGFWWADELRRLLRGGVYAGKILKGAKPADLPAREKAAADDHQILLEKVRAKGVLGLRCRNRFRGAGRASETPAAQGPPDGPRRSPPLPATPDAPGATPAAAGAPATRKTGDVG